MSQQLDLLHSARWLEVLSWMPCLAERLAEGRGSATIATAENNKVSKPCPMPREPRYLQRLVRPALVVRCLGVWRDYKSTQEHKVKFQNPIDVLSLVKDIANIPINKPIKYFYTHD